MYLKGRPLIAVTPNQNGLANNDATAINRLTVNFLTSNPRGLPLLFRRRDTRDGIRKDGRIGEVDGGEASGVAISELREEVLLRHMTSPRICRYEDRISCSLSIAFMRLYPGLIESIASCSSSYFMGLLYKYAQHNDHAYDLCILLLIPTSLHLAGNTLPFQLCEPVRLSLVPVSLPPNCVHRRCALTTCPTPLRSSRAFR